MNDAAAPSRRRSPGLRAIVAVPAVPTAVAFAVGIAAASRFGLIGDLPLWLLLSLLVGACVIGEIAARRVTVDASAAILNVACAVQVLSVTAIIYTIGWGPTLTIGYVCVAARVLNEGGARVWRVVIVWAVAGVALGQLAIAVELVPSYVPAPYVHGIALLGLLGTAFVIWMLGTKTAQNERSNTEVRSALSLLTATLDSTADGILVVDSGGAITQFNSQFARMWQLPDDVLAGRDNAAATGYMAEQLARPEIFVAKVEELSAQPEAEGGDTLEFKDGRVFEGRSRPQRVDGVVVGRVWSFGDVTERNQLVKELAHQAFHDSLTGLANRALLHDRLEHAIARSRRSGATVAVLFCDLDRFKMINDTLGHEAGDLLLVEVARRVERSVREGDTAARLGGDEFAIVLDETAPDDAIVLARRLLDVLRDPFVVNDREIFVRASIGIADNRVDALDVDELLCRADIAMYAAKTRGRDRFEVFQPIMQTELTAHHELHGDLRRALGNGEISLHYQPLLDLATQSIESFEALARWQHPTRGPVGPDDFIPIAEETGLIIDIGRFVLREACRQTTEWRALPGAHNLCVSVNVSAHQLYDDEFVADVQSALHDAGLPPTCLVVELTESTLLSDTILVQHRLDALKKLGIRIAIDDFGTGYSSLAYLRTFPVDLLKIDRSFVNELDQGLDDQARIMVQSIIDIGHNLNLGVVAEGIEHADQLDQLRDVGCNLGQGFLFARALPPDDIPELLRHHTSVASNSAPLEPGSG